MTMFASCSAGAMVSVGSGDTTANGGSALIARCQTAILGNMHVAWDSRSA